MKENVRNFASTTLANPMAFNDSSFTVITGTGGVFPSVDATHPQNFIVSVDTEVILCSQRTGDVFTVAQRGYDNTTATGHSAGASVTHAPTAGMMDHLWSNVGDAFVMTVPPFARGGSAPSTWDDEFERQNGAWSIFPTPPNTPGNDLIDFGVAKSCLRFQRADFSNINYFVYRPFNPGDTNTPFTVTARASNGARIWAQSPNTTPPIVELSMWVSDQTSIANANQGNMARIDHNLNGWQFSVSNPSTSSSDTRVLRVEVIKSSVVTNSSYVEGNWTLAAGYQYWRLYYSGTGTYKFYVGDGLTWRCIGQFNKRINVATLGFTFGVFQASNTRTEQHSLIDWVRVVTGPSAIMPGAINGFL